MTCSGATVSPSSSATRWTISFATATLRSRSGTNMHGSSATMEWEGTAL